MVSASGYKGLLVYSCHTPLGRVANFMVVGSYGKRDNQERMWYEPTDGFDECGDWESGSSLELHRSFPLKSTCTWTRYAT